MKAFAVGDRVVATDRTLAAALRVSCREGAGNGPGRLTGTIETIFDEDQRRPIFGDIAIVRFDDGVHTPYPLSLARHEVDAS